MIMYKFLCGALMVAACSVCALDIKTNDGTVYKNVSISSVTPVGFDVCYTPDGGGLVIKELLFKNLPVEWQKKYNYNPQAADKFLQEVDSYRQKKAEEMKKEYAAWVANQEEEDHLHAAVYASRINVILNVIKSTSFGCIAYADSYNATVTTGHYGKIMVMGMRLVQGNSWVGNLYPVGSTVQSSTDGVLAVYTPSLEQAIILARSGQYKQ